MRRHIVVMAAVMAGAAGLLGGWSARAERGEALGVAAVMEVPNLKPDQLEKNASAIVVGTVTNVWVSSFGRQRSFKADVRVHKVEKGDVKDQSRVAAKTGDTIEVTWGMTEIMPGTTGSNGHRVEAVRVGRVVRLYLTEKRVLLFPNGAAAAGPIFATKETLGTRDVVAARDAAVKATRIGAHEEAAALWGRAVEIQDTADTPEHRLAWAESLWRAERFLESARALEPVALSPKPGSQAAKKRDEARTQMLHTLWASGDSAAYLRGVKTIAKTDGTREGWERLKQAAEWLNQEREMKEAEAELAKLGKSGEGPGKK
jgi:hypothetical protein